jgi:Protein of unknown function (DUF3800)
MFAAFTDESGNDAKSTVFAMASILLCDLSSYYFGIDWSKLLKTFGVQEFSATDFHGRRHNFKRWSDAQAEDFRRSAVNLFLKWEVKHGGVVIPIRDFENEFIRTKFHLRLKPATAKWKKPYLFGFYHIVTDLCEYADHQPKGTYIRPIFDNCQEFMGQARTDYARLNKEWKLGEMYVSNARDYVQLQAADFMVWEYRVDLERRLKTGESTHSATMIALTPHLFSARIWSLEHLNYYRRRVEACFAGENPEAVPHL